MRKEKFTKEQKDSLKKSYFAKKEELDILRDDATLLKWKILSAAYKEGKMIWGMRFTRVQLAKDMDLPLTTVMRCLALDRINLTSWKLNEEGKISVFKLAMIAQLKDRTYQDEIVKLVIEKNLSTCDIKTLKINNLTDIKKEKLRLAVKKGYSRQDAAYNAMMHWIARGNTLLLIKKESLGEGYYKKLVPELLSLKKRLNNYLLKNGGKI